MAERELIPADVRHRLKALSLVARRAIGDRGIGQHASRSRGAGLEFAQYRAYEQGDEPRQIDWKLYARSDRFFVREAERESPVALWILIDASASMAQGDHRVGSTRTKSPANWEQNHPSRIEAARGLAAALAELALAQGDRSGLVALDSGGLRVTPPAGGARQRDRLRLDLHRLTAAGSFPAEPALAPLWERIGARDLVVMLSDWFDPAALALAERLAAAGREVLAIRILTADERDFPFDGGHRFRDPETGEELLGDGPALRADYLDRFAAHTAALHRAFDAAGIRHATLVTDEPLDTPLRRLFGRAG